MSDRDKLIELIMTIDDGYSRSAAEYLADHLIANGVTVQRWIPVGERLPTEDEDRNQSLVGVVNGHNSGYLGFIGAHIFVRYSHEEKCWWSEDYDIEGCKVIYWMPLPEPPKEEA